ncbi:MAG: hypothetical protein ABJ327_17155 [Litoreibacter sp.]
MDKNTSGISCVMGCWLIGLLAGVLTAALLMAIAGVGFLGAAFFGLVIFVAVGLFLSWAFCEGGSASQAEHVSTPQGAGVAASSADASTAKAQTASSAPTTEGASSQASEAAVSDKVSAVSGGTTAPAASVTSDEVAPAETNDAAAAAAVASQAAPTAKTVSSRPVADVKSGTTLSGEDELSNRKGEWKYEGGTESAPKKPAAKTKPATKKKPAATQKAVAEKTTTEKAATKTPAPKKAAPKKAAAKKATPAKVEEKTTAKAAPNNDGGEDTAGKPNLLTAARAGGADDLKQIKGVGTVMEGILHDMGVYHFDQVGAWSADEAAWVDRNLPKFKGRVSRDGWVGQAKILAAGGETEFSKKVTKGGVY